MFTPEKFPKPPQGENKQADGLRTFTGDGTRFLAVPGLKKLNALFVGGVPLPLKIEESYPSHAVDNLAAQETHEVKLVHVDRTHDGTPCLVRSVKSNDGVWQIGVKVQVDGDWEAAKEPDAAQGSAPDGSGSTGKVEAGTKTVPETK